MSTKSINKYNVAVIQQSGKVGTVRYYQKGGNTYVRAAHNAAMSNPRTSAQMVHRLHFASRSALWSAMKGNLANGFTNKTGAQCDYNIFMKLNDGLGVYFTKGQMAKGAQVIFPVQITDGKLESIESSLTSGRIVSNIALGSLTLGTNTTIGDFANAVVANNADFEYGDEIAFVSILQTVNGESIPKITANFYRIVLTKGDTRKVHSVATADGFQTVSGYLGTNASMPQGCFAYIHTRRDSKLMVSSQVLINNNAAMIATYTSDEQYELAAASYGEGQDLFLDPGSDDEAETTAMYTISVGYASGCTSEMGTVSGGGSFAAGASAVISAEAKSGYVFSKWDDDNTSAERTITVSADHEYKALFVEDTANKATISLSIPQSQQTYGCTVRIDNGTAGLTASKTVTKGTQVVITALPDSGGLYVFNGWSDGNNNANRTVTVTDDLSLQASFVAQE